MFTRVKDNSMNMLKTYAVRINNLLNTKRALNGEKVDYEFTLNINKEFTLLDVDNDEANMYFNTALDTTTEVVKVKFHMFEEKSMVGNITGMSYLKSVVTRDKRFYLFMYDEVESKINSKKGIAEEILTKVEEVNSKQDIILSKLEEMNK